MRPIGRRRLQAPWRARGRGPGGQPGNKACDACASPPGDASGVIDDVIAALAERHAWLSTKLDEIDPDDIKSLVRLFTAYSQNASRLGRLLRDQRALSGQAADGIAGAIAQALDELGSELGVPL